MTAPSIRQQKSAANNLDPVAFNLLPLAGSLILAFQFSFGPIAVCTDNQSGHVYQELGEQADANGNDISLCGLKVVNSAGTFTVSQGAAGTGAMHCLEIQDWHGTTFLDSVLRKMAINQGGAWGAAFAELGCLAPEDLILIGVIDQAAHAMTAAVNGAAATQEYNNAVIADSTYVWSLATAQAGNYTASIADGTAGGNTAAMIAIAVRGQGVLVDGLGGGPADDRYRFRNSQLSSGTSTLGTRRSAWPDDARDFGLRDSIADNRSRLN